MTDPAPEISVVIAAYNRADSIRPAVESVLRQSWRDLEVIVVDDGSTDGTFAAIETIGDGRLRILSHETNRGVSAARNTGIAAARGRWIAFQDSDDEWLPQKLERQMRRIGEIGEACVACYCGMAILGQSGGRRTLSYVPGPVNGPIDGDISGTILGASLASTQTLMVRQDALNRIGGFDPDLPALVDWDLMIRLAPLGPIGCVDDPLVLQSFSDNSITRSREKRALARERIVEKNRDRFASRPDLLARHYRSAAGEWRRLGRHEKGRAALARARAAAPLSPSLWLLSAYLLTARLSGRQSTP